MSRSNEWRGATLGDLFILENGRRVPRELDPTIPYVGLEHIETGMPRLVPKSMVSEVTSSVTPFRRDDVLFGRLRPYLRKVALASWEGVCTPEILVLHPVPSVVVPRYLHALASSEGVIKRCIDMSAGSRMPRTSAGDLASIPILLPALPVQRRIADLIAAVDEAIEVAGSARQRLAEFTSCLFEELLEAAHRTEPLGELAVVSGGKRLPRGTPWALEPTAHPYIRVLDLHDGVIDESNLVYVPNEVWRAISRYIVEAGDIVISIVGTIGEVAMVPRSLHMANLTENAARIRTQKDMLHPAFLARFLRSKGGQAQIERLTVGTTQRKLALFRIEQIEVPMLSLRDQEEGAVTVGELEGAATATGSLLLRLRGLRSALLNDLLSGEHEIPESYDEALSG
jgi:type I restriction enzyme S subunit